MPTIRPRMSAYNIILPSEQPATEVAAVQVESTMPATVAVAALFQAPVIPSAMSPATSGYLRVEKRAGKHQRVSSTSFKQDRLGKLVAQSVIAYQHASSWSCYARAIRKRSRISHCVRRLRHRASKYLDCLQQQGAPVHLTGAQPSLANLHARLLRGPHKSALEHVDFVRDKFADFCQQGFWTVLPFDCVKDLPNLRLSPLGVVPQRSQRPRLIVDLSFWGINDETLRDAPIESMQFG